MQSQFSPVPLTLLVTGQYSLWKSNEHGEAMNQHDGSFPAKHAAVVRRASLVSLSVLIDWRLWGFPRSVPERALEVLLRVLKLFEERERCHRGGREDVQGAGQCNL
jgi:hypothetical protein